MPRITPEQAGGKEVCAFLDTIARSEGTSVVPGSEDGYNVLVGGHLFASYATHPNQIIPIPRLGISSTAAGRYQLLARYFHTYASELHLPDFSPISQDLIAIQQIKEADAYHDIQAGDFETAIGLCARIWASLPGSKYGQHEQSFAFLESYYRGRLAA